VNQVRILVPAIGLLALAGWTPAAAAEPPLELDTRVVPAGCEPPVLVKQLATGTRPIFRNQNPFHIELPDLGKEGADISEILLQVFDPDAAPEGAWKGYGLMELRTQRTGVNQLRALSASIDFEAPADGIYCLRTVARDRAGNLEQKANDLRDVQWLVVLDRTAPKLDMAVARGDGKPLEPGAKLGLSWKVEDSFLADPRSKSVEVELSRDGGKKWVKVAELEMAGREGRFEWKVEGPDTEALLFRVIARDAAGNCAVATADKPLAVKAPPLVSLLPVKDPVTGLEPPLVPPIGGPEPVRSPGKALQAYETGVIYMNRGDLEEAARYFELAIRLDVKLAPAFVDLTATYLGLYDRDRALGAGYLDKAVRAATDGLKVLPREVALYYNQAQAQYRLGKLDAAAASLDFGLAVQPRHVESLYMLALVRSTQRRTADAVVLWRQVAALGGMSQREIEKRLAREAVRCLAEVEKQDSGRSSAATTPVAPKSAVQ
jgi:tetratricopeptide (TPR) repeat protein